MESIVKLKVESREYESKIDRARKGLLHMEEACHKAGGTLAYLDKEQLQYVQSLGKMETVSKSVSGKVGELTKAYTELRSQYNRLTEEEKRGQYGKALSQSLNQLKDRIVASKSEMEGINGELKGSQSLFDVFSSKIGVSKELLTKMGAALAAVEAAQYAFNKSLENSQYLGDAYARSQYALNDSVNTFFASLASGDFTPFYNGIDALIQRARDAYDAMDQLGNSTMSLSIINTRENLELQKQMTIMRGATKGTTEYNDALNEAYAIVNRMNAATSVVQSDQWSSIQKQVAAWTGIDNVKFDWVLSAQELDAKDNRDAIKKKAAEDAKTYADEMAHLDHLYEKRKPYTYTLNGEQKTLAGSQSEMEKYNAAVEALNEKYGESIVINTLLTKKNDEALKGLNDLTTAYYSNATAIERNRTTLARLGKDTETKVTDDSIGKLATLDVSKFKEIPSAFQNLNVEAAALTDKLKVIQDFSVKAFQTGSINDFNEQLKKETEILNSLTIGTDAYAQQLKRVNQLKEEMKSSSNDTSELEKDGKKAAAAWSAAGTAMHGVGSALASMDDPSAKILGLIAQGIASVASGAGQAMAAKDTTASGWAWIGAAAAITSEMVAIISTMKSATQYHADGGFVTPSGMARGTDTVPAMLTPGELVLNRAQQTNLANQLGEPNQRQQVEFRIKDRELVGIIGNYYNRQSKVL